MQKFSKGISTLNNGPASAFRQGINENFSTMGYGFDDIGFVGHVTASTSYSTPSAAIEHYYDINQLQEYKAKGDVMRFTPLEGNDSTWIYNGTQWVQLTTGASSGLAYVARTGEYSDILNKPDLPLASTTTPNPDATTGSIGSDATHFALADHVHPDHYHAAESYPVADAAEAAIGIDATHFALADHRHPDHFHAATTQVPVKSSGTGSVGTTTEVFALADHVHPILDNATTVANGLMSYGDKTKVDTLNTKTLILTNVPVVSTGWVIHSDFGPDYEGEYTYKNVVTATGFTENHYPEVVFNITQAESGLYAPIVASGTDTITIYCKDKDEAKTSFYLATVKGTLTI